MELSIHDTKQQMGQAAAEFGAEGIRKAIAERGASGIIVATGASQFEMLSALVKADRIDWSKVTAFHLDEYVGLADTHPASFRKYLRERFVQKLPAPLAAFHYVDGETDPEGECRRLGELIGACEIDVAFVGIGENGHLAFNDPPADFETREPYLVVELDEACRLQQVGEGWFAGLDDVPTRAISMSIRQILASRRIVCTVPDPRKAKAVRDTVQGGIGPQVPASILREHGDCTMFLDAEAASLLSDRA